MESEEVLDWPNLGQVGDEEVVKGVAKDIVEKLGSKGSRKGSRCLCMRRVREENRKNTGSPRGEGQMCQRGTWRGGKKLKEAGMRR